MASAAFPLIWLQSDIRVSALPWFLVGTEKANSLPLIADALRVSGWISIAYGVFAFTALPRTPPKGASPNPFAFVEAFGLLKHRSVLVLSLAAMAISMIHNVYFLRTAPWLTTVGFTE